MSKIVLALSVFFFLGQANLVSFASQVEDESSVQACTETCTPDGTCTKTCECKNCTCKNCKCTGKVCKCTDCKKPACNNCKAGCKCGKDCKCTKGCGCKECGKGGCQGGGCSEQENTCDAEDDCQSDEESI